MKDSKYSDSAFFERNKPLLKIITIIGIVFTLILMGYFIYIDLFNHPEIIQTKLENTGALAPIIYFVFSIFNAIYPIIPGGLGSVIGYNVFGALWGFGLAFSANIIGATLLFKLTQRFGEPLLRLFFKEETINKGIGWMNRGKYIEVVLAIVFIVPGLPDDLFIMITGLSNITTKRVLLIQLIFKPLTMYLYMVGITNLLAFLTTYVFGI